MAATNPKPKAIRAYKRRAPISLQAQPAPAILARACWLDRQADAELHHGHHAAAERLAHQAAQLRGRSA